MYLFLSKITNLKGKLYYYRRLYHQRFNKIYENFVTMITAQKRSLTIYSGLVRITMYQIDVGILECEYNDKAIQKHGSQKMFSITNAYQNTKLSTHFILEHRKQRNFKAFI